MVCQTILLFDLDQSLPLSDSNLGENDLNQNLAALKQALNYLVLQGQRSQVEEGQNVPWISLRTYSSTGYFPNTSSTSNAATTFSELTPKLLDSLTFELESQVDAFLSSRVMSAKELKEHIENGTKSAKPSSTASSSSSSTATGSNRRRKSESESLRRALEEIAALYDWDRPNMQSPVKVSSRSHRKSTDAGSSRLSLGVGKNRIYIVTKLPRNEEELKRFLLYEKKTSSLTVLEKNICNNVFNGQHLNRAFRGDSDVKINLIDTSHFYKNLEGVDEKPGDTPEPGRFRTVFGKALKGHKGWVLPIEVLQKAASNLGGASLRIWSTPKQEIPTQSFTEKLDAKTRARETMATSRNVLETLQRSCLEQEAFQKIMLRKPKSSDSLSQYSASTTAEAAAAVSNKRKRLSNDRLSGGGGVGGVGQGGPSAKQLCRGVSDESIRSRSSNENLQKSSRGAEMLRLGRKESSGGDVGIGSAAGDATSSDAVTTGGVMPSSTLNVKTILSRDIASYKTKLEGLVKAELDSKDTDKIIMKLMELQYLTLSKPQPDAFIAALAQITISTVLQHLHMGGKNKSEGVEDLIEESFLVDTTTIASRKTSLIGDGSGRIRDHKLQVLYRIEIHWLLPNQEKQNNMESQMLAHLRQISIWKGQEEMIKFLQEVLTPTYSGSQSDLLCLLFDELGLNKPQSLADLFSPAKSIAPLSMAPPESAHSLLSASGTVAPPNINLLAEVKDKQKLEKLNKRMSGAFAQIGKRQINVKAVSKRGTRSRSSLPANQASASRKPAQLQTVKRPPNLPVGLRAKRNLSFEGTEGPSLFGDPRVSLSASLVNGQKSPTKRGKGTPKKSQLSTKKKPTSSPARFTPRKTHRVYAQATPSKRKTEEGEDAAPRRKSDGVVFVNDSPDMGEVKSRGALSTPRRIASMALRKKTSFYSGIDGENSASRNLLKAEQQIAQSRFARETAGPSGLSSSLGRRRNQDGANTTSDKRDSFQVLFPHLLKQNEENGEEEGCQPPPVFATPKKTAYSPTKGDGGTPSRRVVFNMEHQPKTPSSGKKTRRSILKSTPSKSAGTGDNLAPSGMMGLLARGDRLSSLRDGYTTPTKTTRSGENAASPLGYENHRTPPSQATRKSPRRELGIPESRIVLTPLKLSGCQDPKKGTSPAKVIKQEVVSPIKGEKEKNPAPLANESLEKPIEHTRIAISSCERVEEPESETENVVDGEAAEEPSLPNLDKNRIVGMKTAAKDIALQIDKKSRESLTAGLQIEKAIESRKAEYSKFLTSYKEDKVNEKLNEDTTTSVDNMGASEKPEEPSKTDQPKKDAGAVQKRRPPSTSGPDNSVLRRSTVVVPSNVAHNIRERKKPSSFTSEEISSRPKPKFPEDENQTADRDSFGQEQSDSRPSRIRSRTTKFGIDDITVAQLISPNKFASPRSLAKAQKNEPDKGITSPLPSSAAATLTPGRASKSPVVIKLNPKGGNSISNNMEDRFSQLLEEPPNSVIISPRTYQRGPRSSNDDPETTAMPEKNDTVFMEDGVAPLSDIEDIGSPKGKKAKSPPKARKRLSNEILQSLRLQAQNDSKMRSAREEEKPRRSLEIEPTDDDDEEAPSVKVKEKSRPKDVAGSDKKSGEPSRKSRANNRRSRSQSQDSADDQAASQDLESEVEVTKQSKKQSLSIKNSNKSRRQSQEETTVVAESGPKKEGRNKKRRSQTNSDAEKDDKERKEASENNRNIKKETESATDGESSELKSKSRKHKKNKKSRRDRESMEDVTSQDMVEVSQVVESDETIVGPHTPERPSDTDDAMRPSRKRTLTNRLGIDDISLNEAISPKQQHRPPAFTLPNRPAPGGEGEAAVASSSSEPAAAEVSSGSKISPPKKTRGAKRKLRLSQPGPKIRIELSEVPLMQVQIANPIKDLIDFADSEDLPAADALLQDDQLLDINLGSPERPQGSTARREGSPEPMKSPGKYWSVSETLDTPEGIKMKINRKKKPNQTNTTPVLATNQRVSRQRANEFGFSPGKIMRLIHSPSPVKRRGSRDSRNQPPSQDAQENESERVEVEVEQPSSDIVVSFNPDVAGPSRAPLVELEKNQEKKRPHKRKRESDPVPRRSYSPMTSYGIYSLTKSPLTKTVEATGSARPAGRAEPEKKKKKVNKKLDYHLAGE